MKKNVNKIINLLSFKSLDNVMAVYVPGDHFISLRNPTDIQVHKLPLHYQVI